MHHVKCFSRFILVIVVAVLFSSGAMAQNGRQHRNIYGRDFNTGVRYNSYRNYISIGIDNLGFHDYNYGYRYGSSYAYYPDYRYHSVYRRPFPFIHFGPTFGLRINILPFGYDRFYIGRNPFYYYEGVYYRPYSNGGYEVTEPPLGATIKHLPAGAKPNVINGQKYYELGGTFYIEETNAKDKLQYVVAGTDGVINTDEQKMVEPENAPTSAAPNIIPETAQQAANLNQLPAGSKVVIISGQKYYLNTSGVYYQEIINANNTVSYKVAGGSETPK